LSCDSDAPQVGSARSDWTRFVKVNRRKTNRRKTRPYCISFKPFEIQHNKNTLKIPIYRDDDKAQDFPLVAYHNIFLSKPHPANVNQSKALAHVRGNRMADCRNIRKYFGVGEGTTFLGAFGGGG